MEEYDEEENPPLWYGFASILTEDEVETKLTELHKTVFEVTGKYPPQPLKIKMGFY